MARRQSLLAWHVWTEATSYLDVLCAASELDLSNISTKHLWFMRRETYQAESFPFLLSLSKQLLTAQI